MFNYKYWHKHFRYIAILYLVYIGFSKFMDSSLEVAEKINKISEIDKIEVSNNKEVVGLYSRNVIATIVSGLLSYWFIIFILLK